MKRKSEVNPVHELKGQELPIGGEGGRGGIGLAALFASVSHLPDKMSSYYDKRFDAALANPVPQAQQDVWAKYPITADLALPRPKIIEFDPATLSAVTAGALVSGFPPSVGRQEMGFAHRRQMMVRSIGESEIRGTPHVIYVSEGFKQLMALSGPFGKVERHRHIALDKFNKASKSMTKKWRKAMKKQAKAFTL